MSVQLSASVSPPSVPHNTEAEQALLGAVLLDNEALNTASETLAPEDFHHPRHAAIFRVMLDLSNAGTPIDTITITDTLRARDGLERAGGASYVASLFHDTPTAAHAVHYARIIREKSLLRKLLRASMENANACLSGSEDPNQILDDAQRRVFEIAAHNERGTLQPVSALMHDTFSLIERLYNHQEMITGISTGFSELDKMTSGFQAGDLIIIAGRPGMGKTSFALNVALHAALAKKIPAAIFSLEMTSAQLVLRLLSSQAEVDSYRIRNGHLRDNDWAPLATAAGRLSEAPIFIDDTSGPTLLEMRAKARRLIKQTGPGLIIVDYLQLVAGNRNADNREREIADISRGLKALAKELAVPVIAVSQLNRAVENRTERRPILADLRESGAIEQDADLIMFVYREEVYKREDESVKGQAEIIVGKQRNGPTGTVKLGFFGGCTKFTETIPNISPTRDGGRPAVVTKIDPASEDGNAQWMF